MRILSPEHASRRPLPRVRPQLRTRENGMMLECQGKRRDSRMPIAFQDSGRADGCGVCLEIPRLGSCSWSEGKKTACGVCGQERRTYYDRKTRRVRDLSCGDTRVYLEFEVRRVDCRSCGAVKREHLSWLASNPFYTKRFAYYVGRRCRASTIRDVARELRLDWRTVKTLEMEYMREQLRRAGTPGPKVIGIDELSVGRGHNYRIVVSDL